MIAWPPTRLVIRVLSWLPLAVLLAPSPGCGDFGRLGDGAPRTLSGPAPAVPPHGPQDGEGDCEVTVTGPASTPVGKTAVALVSLRPGGAFEVNQEAPLSVKTASSNLTPSKASYGIDDASVLAPDQVTMEVPFTGRSAGEHTLDVHAHFGLCSGEACAMCRRNAQMTTRVH